MPQPPFLRGGLLWKLPLAANLCYVVEVEPRQQWLWAQFTRFQSPPSPHLLGMNPVHRAYPPKNALCPSAWLPVCCRNVFQRMRWQALRRFASCPSCHGLGPAASVVVDKDKRRLAPCKDRAGVSVAASVFSLEVEGGTTHWSMPRGKVRGLVKRLWSRRTGRRPEIPPALHSVWFFF